MDGWHTTVTTEDGVYVSPPEDGREEFFALLRRLVAGRTSDTTLMIRHFKEGETPVVRTVEMTRLS